MANDILQIGLSPYNYVWNNPIIIVDPDGREAGPGPWIPYNPLYYVAEGFRQYFAAAGDLFSFTAEYHSNTVVEMKKTLGNVDISQSLIVERKTEVQANFSPYFQSYGAETNVFDINKSTTFKSEDKISATAWKFGPVSATGTAKVEVSKSGMTTSVSGGAKIEKGVASVEVSAGVSTTKKTNGQTSSSVKISGDVTFKSKPSVNKNGEKVAISQKTGVSVSKKISN